MPVSRENSMPKMFAIASSTELPNGDVRWDSTPLDEELARMYLTSHGIKEVDDVIEYLKQGNYILLSGTVQMCG
jgi:hypothetical protein